MATDILEYDPIFFIKTTEYDTDIFIYTLNIITNEMKYMFDIPVDYSEIYLLDSKTLMVIYIGNIYLYDFDSKKLIQEELNVKEHESIGELMFSPKLSYNEHYLSYGERKVINHILLPIFSQNSTDIVYKLYNYKNRKLTYTNFQLLTAQGNTLTFQFLGSKYLISVDTIITIYNLEYIDNLEEFNKNALIISDSRSLHSDILSYDYGTTLLIMTKRHLLNNEESILEIDPKNGKITRVVGLIIPSIKQYEFTKDIKNSGEYIVYILTRDFHLFVLKTVNNQLYLITAIKNKLEMKMIKKKSLSAVRKGRYLKNRGNIVDFNFLQGNNILLRLQNNENVIFNIKYRSSKIIGKTDKVERIILISNKIFLIGNKIIDIDTGENRTLGIEKGKDLYFALPFIVDEEKEKMKNKIVSLFKDNFIPINIVNIIAKLI